MAGSHVAQKLTMKKKVFFAHFDIGLREEGQEMAKAKIQMKGRIGHLHRNLRPNFFLIKKAKHMAFTHRFLVLHSYCGQPQSLRQGVDFIVELGRCDLVICLKKEESVFFTACRNYLNLDKLLAQHKKHSGHKFLLSVPKLSCKSAYFSRWSVFDNDWLHFRLKSFHPFFMLSVQSFTKSGTNLF